MSGRPAMFFDNRYGRNFRAAKLPVEKDFVIIYTVAAIGLVPARFPANRPADLSHRVHPVESIRLQNKKAKFFSRLRVYNASQAAPVRLTSGYDRRLRS